MALPLSDRDLAQTTISQVQVLAGRSSGSARNLLRTRLQRLRVGGVLCGMNYCLVESIDRLVPRETGSIRMTDPVTRFDLPVSDTR